MMNITLSFHSKLKNTASIILEELAKGCSQSGKEGSHLLRRKKEGVERI